MKYEIEYDHVLNLGNLDLTSTDDVVLSAIKRNMDRSLDSQLSTMYC